MSLKNLPPCPRGLNHIEHALPNLPAPATPPVESLSDRMWQVAEPIAQAALQSDFLQGIRHGTLHPGHYGKYMVQDAVYCAAAVEDYHHLVARAQRPDVKACAEARLQHYAAYTANFLKAWHIRASQAIELSPEAEAYRQFENMVATTYDPIYTFVLMLPCSLIWMWSAQQMRDGVSEDNCYSFWITENLHHQGAPRLAAYIDAHAERYDVDKATEIYVHCMLAECNLFRVACEQAPLKFSSQGELVEAQ